MNTSGFDEKVAYAKEKLRELNDTVHIKTDIDNGALKQIAQDTEAIHRMMGSRQALSIRANLDDADAKARLAVLTRPRSTTIHVRTDTSQTGMFGRLLDKAGGALGGSFGIPGIGGQLPVASLAAIVPAAAAALVELTGVVAGFAAAGAGAAAFAALAAPAVHKVTSAYSGLKQAQQAYNNAKEKEALDPSKANQTAVTKAADNLKLVREQISKMSGPEQAAITGITNLSSAFGKMSKKFEPKAFEVFSSGLRLAASLLPHLTPFANTFADSLSKIFNNLDKSSKGKGFQDFLKGFHGIEGPAINAIAAGIGNVAGSLGRLLTVMSGKDVAHTINIAFSGISGTIGGITASVRFLMNTWDGMFLAARNVASAFAGIRHAAAGVGHSIANEFDTARHAVASFSPAGIIRFFAGLGGKIKGALSGAAGWLVSAGQAAIGGLEKGAKGYWANVQSWFAAIPGRIKSAIGSLGGLLTSAGQAVMQGFLNGLQSMWGKVTSFVSGIAGWVKAHKGPLDYDAMLLYPAGQAIMDGLNRGLASRQGALTHQLTGITRQIQGAGWVGQAGPGLAGSHGGSAHALAGGGGGDIHVHVTLDGREITSVVQQRSVATQMRTGHNGMQKRTR